MERQNVGHQCTERDFHQKREAHLLSSFAQSRIVFFRGTDSVRQKRFSGRRIGFRDGTLCSISALVGAIEVPLQRQWTSWTWSLICITSALSRPIHVSCRDEHRDGICAVALEVGR
jgi:hypothetical protein